MSTSQMVAAALDQLRRDLDCPVEHTESATLKNRMGFYDSSLTPEINSKCFAKAPVEQP